MQHSSDSVTKDLCYLPVIYIVLETGLSRYWRRLFWGRRVGKGVCSSYFCSLSCLLSFPLPFLRFFVCFLFFSLCEHFSSAEQDGSESNLLVLVSGGHLYPRLLHWQFYLPCSSKRLHMENCSPFLFHLGYGWIRNLSNERRIAFCICSALVNPLVQLLQLDL